MEIELGAKKFTITPLTIGQVREIDLRLRRPPGPEEESSLDQSLDIIAVALQHAAPWLAAREKLLAESATATQIAASATAIIKLAMDGEPALGEPAAATAQ